LLRVFVGTAVGQDSTEHDRVWVLENQSRRCPRGHRLLHEQLFAGGALDVFTIAIQMKKTARACY